jgi:hypothetical protein
MSFCNINFSNINKSFTSNDMYYTSPNCTVDLPPGESVQILSTKSNENIPCQVFLLTGVEELDLSQVITFDKSFSFRIKVIFNGTQESFNLNLINVSCDNENIMSFNFNYT